MNWDVISGQWKQLKGKAQQRWGKLSDSDWDRIEGKREQLVGRLQELYGKQQGRGRARGRRLGPRGPLARDDDMELAHVWWGRRGRAVARHRVCGGERHANFASTATTNKERRMTTSNGHKDSDERNHDHGSFAAKAHETVDTIAERAQRAEREVRGAAARTAEQARQLQEERRRRPSKASGARLRTSRATRSRSSESRSWPACC